MIGPRRGDDEAPDVTQASRSPANDFLVGEVAGARMRGARPSGPGAASGLSRPALTGARRPDLQGGLLGGADVRGLPAAGTEPAARRWVRRARHVALEHDRRAPP